MVPFEVCSIPVNIIIKYLKHNKLALYFHRVWCTSVTGLAALSTLTKLSDNMLLLLWFFALDYIYHWCVLKYNSDLNNCLTKSPVKIRQPPKIINLGIPLYWRSQQLFLELLIYYSYSLTPSPNGDAVGSSFPQVNCYWSRQID